MSVKLTQPEIRENYLRTVEFRYPKWIPCHVGFVGATWYKYREELEEILLKHPKIFPFFKKGSIDYDNILGVRRKGNIVIDGWGCKWKFEVDGLQGQVIEHPLEDWSKFREFSVPDPEDGVPQEGYRTITWDEIEESVKRAREEGALATVSMGHGFFFQRLYYLRGYTNLLKDFIRKPPQIYQLIEMVTEFTLELVKKAVKLKPDMITFGDDLGNQYRMPISPRTFREFIYPTYKKIFTYIRSHGIHVYLHSDGHVMEVVDQLIDTGVSVLNLQERVNRIENIKRLCKGKICIDLDFDRQRLMPYGTPQQIEDHVKYSIQQLGSRKGGLMLEAWVAPEVPLENIDAICSAYEKYMYLHKELE